MKAFFKIHYYDTEGYEKSQGLYADDFESAVAQSGIQRKDVTYYEITEYETGYYSVVFPGS